MCVPASVAAAHGEFFCAFLLRRFAAGFRLPLTGGRLEPDLAERVQPLTRRARGQPGHPWQPHRGAAVRRGAGRGSEQQAALLGWHRVAAVAEIRRAGRPRLLRCVELAWQARPCRPHTVVGLQANAPHLCDRHLRVREIHRKVHDLEGQEAFRDPGLEPLGRRFSIDPFAQHERRPRHGARAKGLGRLHLGHKVRAGGYGHRQLHRQQRRRAGWFQHWPHLRPLHQRAPGRAREQDARADEKPHADLGGLAVATAED
mmetsp:Transcript_44771/g.130371  ORF Transcript_44771/g.130371 Transcript_44771/m.130371 type:complete len:258 (-) Transcript_44771:605-1378(-)